MLPRAFAVLIALLVAGCFGGSNRMGSEGSEDVGPDSSPAPETPTPLPTTVGNPAPAGAESHGQDGAPSSEPPGKPSVTRTSNGGLEVLVKAYHGHATIAVPRNGTLELRQGPASVWKSDVEAGDVEIGFLEPNRIYDAVFTVPGGTVTSTFQTPNNTVKWNGDVNGAGPGRYLVAEASSFCTAGFLLRNATNSTIYLMTAGHCYPVGTIVKDAQYRAIGVVDVSHHVDGLDYALIRVDPTYRPLVQAGLPHWTGPSAPQDHIVEPDDVICGYGYGAYISATEQTRARCGRFGGVDRQTWGGQEMDFWFGSYIANDGDSGGPIVDASTGMPIGIVLAGIRGFDVSGITFCSVIDLAYRMHGLELRLVPAQYVHREPTIEPLPVPVIWGNTPLNLACSP